MVALAIIWLCIVPCAVTIILCRAVRVEPFGCLCDLLLPSSGLLAPLSDLLLAFVWNRWLGSAVTSSCPRVSYRFFLNEYWFGILVYERSRTSQHLKPADVQQAVNEVSFYFVPSCFCFFCSVSFCLVPCFFFVLLHVFLSCSVSFCLRVRSFRVFLLRSSRFYLILFYICTAAVVSFVLFTI